MTEAGPLRPRRAAFLERNERSLVVLAVPVSLAVQANATARYGYVGLDFEDHLFKLKSVLVDPLLVVGTQDAPLPYYLVIVSRSARPSAASSGLSGCGAGSRPRRRPPTARRR